MAAYPGYDTFKAMLNQKFQVKHNDNSVEMTLTEVSDKKNCGGFCSFSVILCGDKNTRLEQNNYQVTHNELGEMNLLIVPVGENKKSIEYQAVFSQKQE